MNATAHEIAASAPPKPVPAARALVLPLAAGALLFVLALGLRLLVWRWREFYALGGDEREYLDQALTLLQQQQYVELQLMRPPLYGFFLAGCIQLVDSLVQNLRLVQAVISAATLLPTWLLARALFLPHTAEPTNRQRVVPWLAVLLMALNYTLAANATELLSETIFLFGLTSFFWLLVVGARRLAAGTRCWPWLVAAALTLALLCLTRSVALPLLPLSCLWLLFQTKDERRKTKGKTRPLRNLLPIFLFTFTFSLILLPWTARNYRSYGGLILIDTTGAENLWLDNNPAQATAEDPLGREAAKRQLYALGNDRLARQQLATRQGIAAITSYPGWFVQKAGGELLQFFALEYSDDMRARPTIWLPPAEVWLRLLLGDALWLLLLLAGTYGLVAAPAQRPVLSDPRWLLVPWALYIPFTALIFHVELRYRLPLYPVLLPYAALALAGEDKKRVWYIAAWILPFTFLFFTFLHNSYPTLAWQLGWKHYHLLRAEQALNNKDAPFASQQATAALALDDRSALARVALARARLLRNDTSGALAELDAAIDALPRHPHAHLLRGDLLRLQGKEEPARAELAEFEQESLEDLQAWLWQRAASAPTTQLDLGGGLDLGFVHGFYAAEAGGWRWTKGVATLQLAAPANSARTLQLRLASGRPAQTPNPQITLLANGQMLAVFYPTAGWQSYEFALPAGIGNELVVELRSATFTPRSYNPASSDGRTLGVMLDNAAVQ